MKGRTLCFLVAAAGLGVGWTSNANAIGCFSGGVAGAIAGHMAHHGVLGAIGGCIAGHELNKHQHAAAQAQSEQQPAHHVDQAPQPNGSTMGGQNE